VITMPVAFALGAAGAPALLRPPGRPRRLRRGLLAVVALVAIAALVPFYLSERYTKDALRHYDEDLPQAYSKLEKAANLNRLSERPLVAEAVIAESSNEPQRALAALSEAQQRTPTEWTLYYLEARVYERIDPAAAQRALDRARALNPNGPEIPQLQKQFDSAKRG
jgi:tetratricopeptide (TPR) repeat protein